MKHVFYFIIGIFAIILGLALLYTYVWCVGYGFDWLINEPPDVDHALSGAFLHLVMLLAGMVLFCAYSLGRWMLAL